MLAGSRDDRSERAPRDLGRKAPRGNVGALVILSATRGEAGGNGLRTLPWACLHRHGLAISFVQGEGSVPGVLIG